MKRGSKITLGIACASIGIGIVIIMLSFALPGSRHKYTSTYSEEVFGVDSIDLDIKYGKVTIEEGDRFKIVAENIAEGGIQSYTEDNTWYIKQQYSDEESINLFGWTIPISFQLFGFGNDYYPKILVTIPRDLIAEKVAIELGVGELLVEDVDTRLANFEIGAGSMKIKRLNVLDKFNCEVGAGELIVNNIETKDSVLEIGVGSMQIKGEILGDLYADCGVGEIKLDLNGREEDYNYNISCGLGDMELNDKSYSFSADETIRNDNAIGTFDLNCGVGSLDISIQ